VVVPYSKYQVAGRPFGSTVPFSVADAPETAVAAPVTTSGGCAAAVVIWPSAPVAVPLLFVATNR
jgi:hypothetical protein